MSSQLMVPIGWMMHIIACHYIVRHLHDTRIRAVLSVIPCIVLSFVGSLDLPQYQMSSLVIVSLYWIMSIRIIQCIVFLPNEDRPFYWFVLKLFWSVFPIIPSEKTEAQWPIIFDFISGFVKMMINHWMFRWISGCEASENNARLIMISILILTSLFIMDFQTGFVRLVTRDKYTLLSAHNFPLFSKSLREFWGRRYNRLTSTVFKECIFQPARSCGVSPLTAALLTFLVSGLLHVHSNLVMLHDANTIVPTLSFFLLHGIACCVETHWGIRLPAPLGWLMTYSFIFVTLPLAMGSSARQGPVFFGQNPPPFLDSPWIPKLPVPNTCLM